MYFKYNVITEYHATVVANMVENAVESSIFSSRRPSSVEYEPRG